jgi:hypothetical protein
MRQDFMVYCHKRPTDGSIFYVGKGCANRATRSDGRNNYWNNIVNKHGGFDVEIVAENLTEAEALKFEVVLIKGLRDAGVGLCNLTDGGEGVSGFRHSDEAKERMKITNKGKTKSGHRLSEEHRKKLCLAKLGRKQSKEHAQAAALARVGRVVSDDTRQKISQALTGKPISEEHKRKLMKPVICLTTGEEFESVKAACDKYSLHRQSIAKCCRGKLKETGGLAWQYKELTS